MLYLRWFVVWRHVSRRLDCGWRADDWNWMMTRHNCPCSCLHNTRRHMVQCDITIGESTISLASHVTLVLRWTVICPCLYVLMNLWLKIGHLNIRSLSNKIDKVRIIMNEHNFGILAISETWLSDDMPSETVHVSGYHLYMNDRRSHGGGVLLYIKDTIQHTYRPEIHQSFDTEIVWAKINNGSSYPCYIACVYNP